MTFLRRKRTHPMLISAVARIVGFCTRQPWLVIALALLAAVASAAYTATHFAITTDVNQLISPDLDWRKREAAYDKAFPGPFGTTLAVVEAPTSELATQASVELVQRLSTQTNLFHSVRDLGGGEYFARYALLFQPADELGRTSQGLGRAGPLIEALSNDPSLRGVTRALSFGLIGVMSGQAKLDDLQRPLTMSADTLDNVFAGKSATFSWRQMVTGKPADAQEVRHFIEVRPVLDYSALEPGRTSSDAIREAVSSLDLASKYQARVRLTGSVPMADEEFATVQQGALVNGLATVVVVLLILWLALRSARIITAVFINLFVGLAVTAALGLLMVHALNMISVAFAVLFIGLGVDFGIQFAVRYRTERHEVGGLHAGAGQSAAEKIGAPLTLAAAAVAAGFLSFLPTNYKGVSELGQIAGVGMLIAYATSITLLPALLTLFNPPGEPAEIGYRILAPVDRFLRIHRIPVIAGTGLVALLGATLLYWLTFDFNPINLRSKSVESISTFLDLRSDPNLGANAINVVKPSLKEATAAAVELRKLSQVRRALTLQDLVPQDQDRKVAMIQTLRRQLEPILQKPAGAAPNDAQNVAALNGAADALIKTAGTADTPGAKAAKRLAGDLTKLAKADKALRDKADEWLSSRRPEDHAGGPADSSLQAGAGRRADHACRTNSSGSGSRRTAARASRCRRTATRTTTRRCGPSRARSWRNIPTRSARRSRSLNRATPSSRPLSRPVASH